MTTSWIVTEGKAGMESQCLGVAEALGLSPAVKRVGLREPWRTLSPWLGCERAGSFSGDPLAPPFPGLVIACGRRGFAAARYIKKASGGKSFIAYLQDPRVRCRALDLIAVPAHDRLRDENVLVTQAAPNRVSAQWLAKARAEFAPLLSPLPGPRVALLIGGNSAAYHIGRAELENICALARAAVPPGGSLMATASRRTGPENLRFLAKTLRGPDTLFWDGAGANPYPGYLAWADFILATPDSVSMISEAASTGRPVYVIPLPGGAKRIARFHESLVSQGIIRWLAPGAALEAYAYPPLADSARIAAEIRRRLPGV
jgi:mitochondrial fission protein ELM1